MIAGQYLGPIAPLRFISPAVDAPLPMTRAKAVVPPKASMRLETVRGESVSMDSASTEILLITSTGFLDGPHGKLWGMTDTPGKRLKQAREKYFDSAAAAAKRHGWPVSTYASHENGQTREIPHEAARRYARAFKTTASWLNHGEVEMVIPKDRLEKLLKSIPPDSQPEAIQYLEFLAARRRK